MFPLILVTMKILVPLELCSTEIAAIINKLGTLEKQKRAKSGHRQEFWAVWQRWRGTFYGLI